MIFKNLKNLLIIGVATSLSAFAGIIHIHIMSINFSAQEIADLSLIIGLSWVMIPFFKFGTTEYIYRTNNIRELKSLINFQLIFGFLIIPISTLIISYFEDFWISVAISGYWFCRGFIAVQEVFYLKEKKYHSYLLFRFLFTISLMFSLIYIIEFSNAILSYTISYIIADVIVFLYWSLRNQLFSINSLKSSEIKIYLNFGKYTLGSILPVWLVFQSDKVFGNFFLDASVLAILVYSNEIAKGVKLINRSINNYFIAQTVQYAKNYMITGLNRIKNIYLVIIFLIILLTILSSGLFKILLPDFVQLNILLFLCYVLVNTLELTPKVFGNALVSIGLNKYRFKSKVISSIISVSFGLILILIVPNYFGFGIQFIFFILLFLLQRFFYLNRYNEKK